MTVKKLSTAICLATAVCVFAGGILAQDKPLAPPPIPSAAPAAPPKEGTAPASPAAPKAAEPKKYVIKSGDNPWLVAKNHGISLEELLKVNDIKNPKNLKIGDVLILPAGVKSQGEPASKPTEKKPAAVAAKPDAAPAVAVPQAGDGWELYTIKRGDNPWNISKRLKLDHQKIISLNEGVNFRDLKIGQKIKIPKKS